MGWSLQFHSFWEKHSGIISVLIYTKEHVFISFHIILFLNFICSLYMSSFKNSWCVRHEIDSHYGVVMGIQRQGLERGSPRPRNQGNHDSKGGEVRLPGTRGLRSPWCTPAPTLNAASPHPDRGFLTSLGNPFCHLLPCLLVITSKCHPELTPCRPLLLPSTALAPSE